MCAGVKRKRKKAQMNRQKVEVQCEEFKEDIETLLLQPPVVWQGLSANSGTWIWLVWDAKALAELETNA